MDNVKRVFISYAWDTVEDSNKVLNLSNYLRSQGIDANIDQYEESPHEGWPRWMENQIKTSDYVLIVASKTYQDKLDNKSIGKGITWEINIIYQYLYDSNGVSQKFIPIYFDNADIEFIPIPIKKYTYYGVSNTQEIEKLCNRIKGIPNVIKPPLGISESLPKKERKILFIANPIINTELWNKAKWNGIVFLFDIQKSNNIKEIILGLQYEGNRKSAIEIFEEWKTYDDINDYIDIKFIEGEIEGEPEGYTCLIQPSLSGITRRMSNMGIDFEENLILSIARFHRMCPKDNFQKFNMFKKYYKDNPSIKIIPVVLKNLKLPLNIDNLEPIFNYAIKVNNISFIYSKDIKKDSVEACVIPKYCSYYENDNKRWDDLK